MNPDNDPSRSTHEDRPAPADESFDLPYAPPSTLVPQRESVEQGTTPRVKKTYKPEQVAAEIARLDYLIVGTVMVLAFFLGSFLSTNSDVWRHLATGRLLAEGKYEFG